MLRRLRCDGRDQGGDADRAAAYAERRAIRRDDDKTGGGREDNSYSDSDEGYTCTYIGGTNYVALTREGEGT